MLIREISYELRKLTRLCKLEALGINAIIFFLLMLLFGNTIFSSGYIISGDFSMPLFPKQFKAFFWPTWDEYQNASVMYSLPFLAYPSMLLIYFLVSTGILSVVLALKLGWIVIPFFIGGNAFYYFIKKEFLQKMHQLGGYSSFIVAVYGVFIFLASPASLNLLVQSAAEFQTMTLFPLLLFLLKKSYTMNSKKFIVSAALVLAMTLTNPNSVVISITVVLTFLAFHINLRNIIKTLAISLLSIAYSSFWIFPTFFSGPESSGFIVSNLFLQGKDIIPVLTGLAWYASPPVNYPLDYSILWLLPPMLAVIPLIVREKRSVELRIILSLTAMLLLSISLIQGAKGIGEIFYVFISQYFGLFAALFRVTYHFYSMYVLSVASLSSLGLAEILLTLTKSGKRWEKS